MSTKTIFDAYSEFQANSRKVNKSTLRSVIHRFLVEHWSGAAPAGNKATTEEVFALNELLRKLPVSLLLGSMEILEEGFKNKNIAKENTKSYKSAYKQFLDWVECNNYYPIVLEEAEQSFPQRVSTNKNLSGDGKKVKVNYHNQLSKPPYALMAKCKWTKENPGKLVYPEDYINNDLAEEIRTFEIFRTQNHNCSKATVQKDRKDIYRILGWFHRFKNIPLENLSLNLIIKFMKLNLSHSDFKNKRGRINYSEYEREKAMVRQDAINLANENKRLIEEYTHFVGGHPGSKIMIVVFCIAVAKFVFRNEVGTDEYTNENELPTVIRLKQLCNTLNKKLKSTAPAVPHSNKSIEWLETFDLLQILRKRVHLLRYESSVTRIGKTVVKEYIKCQARNKNTIANDLQTFLSLAFMIVIPVDRARTYYELEIGRTFVYGLRKSGRFTPVDKLEDKTQAIWYIHLMADDYKTGKIYKEYWGEMPNVDFGDGNKLYDYIHTWISESRNCLQECNHNYFFRQHQLYKPLNSGSWGQRIKLIFAQETNTPVTPKELRKMYITYLNNRGVSNTVLKGAAEAMHHSQKMQESVYNSQTILERIAPVYDFNEKMFKEVFGSSSKE